MWRDGQNTGAVNAAGVEIREGEVAYRKWYLHDQLHIKTEYDQSRGVDNKAARANLRHG